MIGDGHSKKSMAYVGNVAGFLAHALGFGPGVHLYNYVDKPDADMNGLHALADRTLGRGRLLHIPMPSAWRRASRATGSPGAPGGGFRSARCGQKIRGEHPVRSRSGSGFGFHTPPFAGPGGDDPPRIRGRRPIVAAPVGRGHLRCGQRNGGFPGSAADT